MENEKGCIEQLYDWFEKYFKRPDSADQSLLDSGIMDSTGVLELVDYLEETYNIKIEDELMVPEWLDSIDNIKKLIVHKLAGEPDEDEK